jgi:hypothetical protein
VDLAGVDTQVDALKDFDAADRGVKIFDFEKGYFRFFPFRFGALRLPGVGD